MKNIAKPAVKRGKSRRSEVVESSGNVFADLGLPHTEIDMLKVNIALAISAAIEKRKLTQAKAAIIIGTDQAKVSSLSRGNLKGFTVERLITFLTRLGRDIEVNFPKTTKASAGRIRIRNAA